MDWLESLSDSLGLSNHGAVEAAQAAYDQIAQAAGQTAGSNQQLIDQYAQLLRDTYGNDAGKYGQALADYLGSETLQTGDFNPTGSVEDFYDRFANQRAAQAMDAINGSAATGGNRFSSDYIARVGAKQQALASEEWEKAYQKLMQDRQMQLQTWQANNANQWNNYRATQDKLKAGVDAYGTAQQQLVQGMGDVTTGTINNNNANLQTQASAMGGNAQAGLQERNAMQTLLPAAAQFAGAFFGA